MALNNGIAAALGFFDGVHLGHAEIIKKTVQSGYCPVVLTFDDHPYNIVKKINKIKLITPRDIKTSLIADLGAESVYLNFHEYRNLQPDEFIKKLIDMGVRHVVCGFNYKFGAGAGGGICELRELCAEYNMTYEIVDPIYCGEKIPVSSSRIRELLYNGDITEAIEFLGHPFYIEKPVIHGNKLGAKLGFPTVNQRFCENDLIPAAGVYASLVCLDGEKLEAVTNIGVRPTVGDTNTATTETYILDYNRNFYGETLRVALLNKIRDEIKFNSVDELKNQIQLDVDTRKSNYYLVQPKT